MNDTDINDKRNPSEFKGVSFSKFQKTKVKQELINCLASAKIESACYWTAELICSGHFTDLWEIIITYVSRYIHLGNPKLPMYIAMRMENFKTILSNGYIDSELRLRNNQKIRQLFAEVIIVLCFSRKKHGFSPVKIKKAEEFNMTNMSSRLKAPSVIYANKIFQKDDPKELFIAINEFAYHISPESKNVVSACYWLEWLLEFDNLSKKKREKCLCERRTFAPVLSQYQMDPVWIIWDVILKEAVEKKSKAIQKIINSLLTIFSLKFTPGVKKRRRYVIYFVIALLTEPVDLSIEMIADKAKIDAIVKKISIVYKDVKKNEISPETDYLFAGTKKSNLDKTIERLEKMNNISGMLPQINTNDE